MFGIHKRDSHFYLTVIFYILSVPLAILARLNFTPSVTTTGAFLFGWIFHSIVWAAVLYQFCVPGSWSSFRDTPVRLVFLVLMGIGLVFGFGAVFGIEGTIVGAAIAEFYFRKGSWSRVASAILPWLYISAGIGLALFYSSIIVTFRPCTEFDTALGRLDTFLLFGNSVIHMSNAAASLYIPAEYIYYSIGGAMGTGIIFLCLAGDQREAFQMCGAILTAYFISLVIFYIFPAQGPFIAAALPSNLMTASIQRISLTNATILYHHMAWIDPPRAYYVAFPSMHVAQPLIAAWFLRRWRVVSTAIAAYCVLLVGAIIILRWHYAADLLAGFFVAALAVWIVSAGQPMTAQARGKASEGALI